MTKINRILLIDDSKAINAMHEALLIKYNIANEIISTTSADDAIYYISKGDNGKAAKVDLIFLDLEMPEESGFEFLERYKALGSNIADYKNTVIVVVSNVLTIDNFTKGKDYQEVGLQYQTKKPFDAYDLEEILIENFDIDLDLP